MWFLQLQIWTTLFQIKTSIHRIGCCEWPEISGSASMVTSPVLLHPIHLLLQWIHAWLFQPELYISDWRHEHQRFQEAWCCLMYAIILAQQLWAVENQYHVGSFFFPSLYTCIHSILLVYSPLISYPVSSTDKFGLLSTCLKQWTVLSCDICFLVYFGFTLVTWCAANFLLQNKWHSTSECKIINLLSLMSYIRGIIRIKCNSVHKGGQSYGSSENYLRL